MEVNAVVPNVVLHFHGFRLSRLNSLEDALCHLALDMLRKTMVATAACSASAVAIQAAHMAWPVLADGFVSGLITFATFSSCTVLAQGPAMLAMHQQQQQQQQQQQCLPLGADADDLAAMKSAAMSTPSTLPLLSTRLLAPTTGAPSAKLQHPGKVAAAAPVVSTSTSRLAPARRRMLGHLKRGPPIVNAVPGETRRRAQMSLHNAKIRVGKAHMQLLPGAKKPQDMYMVRVDCGSGETAADEKHMNPVIMWDITATFDEFKKLEHELKRETKSKKLSVKVPHLSSGAVLFVQKDLTDHVLNARRARLQTFVDAIRTNAALAGTDSLRKFCQAY